MKRILFVLALLTLFVGTTQAQFSIVSRTNVDSLTGVRGKVATDLFGAYKYINLQNTNDLGLSMFITRTLWISMTGVTDSVKLQGGVTRVQHKTGAKDTVWQDITVRDLAYTAAKLTAAGWPANKDTAYTWISDVGVDRGTSRIVDFSPYVGFDAYRLVTGINDTTKMYYRVMGRKNK